MDPDSVNSIWLPTLIVFVGSYLIAMGFFNVYSMAVSTIFLCFLEDLDRNDGSPVNPYRAYVTNDVPISTHTHARTLSLSPTSPVTETLTSESTRMKEGKNSDDLAD